MKEAHRGDDDDSTWRNSRNRLEVGLLVGGVIVEHHPFGMFVNIGNSRFLGLVELPSMDEALGSGPGQEGVIHPAVGTRIKAIFIGFASPDGRQPRLRVRQSALGAAEALQQVADLPTAQRRAFVQKARDSHCVRYVKSGSCPHLVRRIRGWIEPPLRSE